MNGSIRFNDDINIEVAVDPTAAEGARLVSATNLVDGQGIGDGGGLPDVTAADAGNVLAVNASGEWVAENLNGFIAASLEEGSLVLSKSWAELATMLSAHILPYFVYHEDNDYFIYRLQKLTYIEGYIAIFAFASGTEANDILEFNAETTNSTLSVEW